METDFVIPRLLPRIIDRGAGRDTDGSPPYGALYPSFFERITMSSDVVDVFLYNTAKDSDGGAWTNGPLAQASSWYNEQLNTATRGATREFPKLALIVAELNKVTIFDATDYNVPMWMVFETGQSGSGPYFPRMLGGLNTISSVSAKNGKIGVANNVSNAAGLNVVFFIGDTAFCYTDTAIEENYPGFAGTWNTNIVSRNNYDGYDNVSKGTLVARTINDVAMTILDGAPVDPDTGIAVPTIQVNTDGGNSIIDGVAGAGTVVDSAEGVKQVAGHINADGSFISVDELGNVNVWDECPAVDSVAPDYIYNDSSIPAVLGLPNNLTEKALGAPEGLTLLKEDKTSPADGMINRITSDYQSGFQVGDIKGAWLADTEEGDIAEPLDVADRSVNDNPLQVIGELTRTPVASGAELVVYSGFSVDNYLEQQYNPDLDFGTGDFYVMGWAVVNVDTKSQIILQRDSSPTGRNIALWFHNSGNLYGRTHDGSSARTLILPYSSGLIFIVLARRGNELIMWVNNTHTVVDATGYGSLDNSNATLRFGLYTVGTFPLDDGSLSLWRMGKGAPTDEQIEYIYNKEKKLFEPGAYCTLLSGGNVTCLSSNGVTMIAGNTDNAAAHSFDLIDSGRPIKSEAVTGTPVAVSQDGYYTALAYNNIVDLRSTFSGIENLPE